MDHSEENRDVDDRVLTLSEEYLQRCRDGERPSIDEYTSQFPDLAARIRDFFPLVARMEHIAIDEVETLHSEPESGNEDGEVARPVPQQFGDFLLEEPIGRGGMGVVYRATQVSLGRKVAVKVLASDRAGSRHDRERFQREAEAVANLHHTNIVPIFGVGEQDGTPFFAMQLIEGRPLHRELNEIETDRAGDTTVEYRGRDDLPHGRSPVRSSATSHASEAQAGQKQWRRIARIGTQVADALHHAHAHGILHRDIKPANLLLDRAGVVWVTDFGLAKTEDSDLTAHGDVVGTLRYIAPESFSGQTDERSDLYSLGLTLYELLAGHPAFDAAERAEILQRIVDGDMPSLQKCAPGVPLDLATIVKKATELRPDDRYQSAGELAEELRRFANDEPIVARRLSVIERLTRWARRNRTVAALSATLFLLLLCVSVASTIASIHFYRLEGDQRRLSLTNGKIAKDNVGLRKNAEAELATSKRALSDLYCENGIRAGESSQAPMAALWFTEAARTADGIDQYRVDMNVLRARNSLRLCPRPVIQFTSGQIVDRLKFHPSGAWLISTPSRATGKDYLWDVTSGRRHEFPSQVGTITALAWNESGDLLAAGTDKGQVHLFRSPDFDSPILTSSLVPDQTYMIRELEFSRDGAQLAAIREKHVVLFSPIDLSEQTLGESHSNDISGIGFNEDGRWLYSFSESDQCRVFSTKSKEIVLQTDHYASANGWTICRPVFADEDRVVTWDSGLVWTEITTGKEQKIELPRKAFQLTWVPPLKKVFVTCNGASNGYLCRPGELPEQCGSGDTLTAVYCKARNELLSAGTYRQISVYDVGSGTSRMSPLFQPSAFRALETTPDGQFLANADYSNTIHVWSYPEKNEFIDTIPVGRYPADVNVHPDSKHVLIRLTHRNARVYRLESREPAGPELVPQGKVIESLWHPDGNAVLTLSNVESSAQAVIDIWDWKSGKRIQPSVTIDMAPRQTAMTDWPQFAVHPKGRMVAFVSNSMRCVIASLDSTNAWREIESVPCNYVISSSSDQSLILVTEDRANRVTQINRVNWEGDDPVKAIETDIVAMVRLMHDRRTLGTSTNGSFIFADAETLETSDFVSTRADASVKIFSAAKRHIAMRSEDDYVRTFSLSDGSMLHPPVDRAGDRIGLTPDGRILIIPNQSGICRLIDTTSGTPICPEFSLGQAKLWSYSGARRISVSPDSRFIAIGGTPHVAIIDLESLMPAKSKSLQELIHECETISGHRIEQGRPTAITND